MVFKNDKHSTITTLNKVLDILDDKYHYIHRQYYRPDNYGGRGNLPNVSWLSKKGKEKAQELWPVTNPKSFASERSPLGIPHDILRAETHIAIDSFCETESFGLGWIKGGYHLVKQDDMYEITKTKTAHFFHEEENKRKSLEELYKKLKPYVDYHNTPKMKEVWGFSRYNVTIPMRDEKAVESVLTHFRGECNCIDPKFRRMHKNASFKLITDILWFTTHEQMVKNTAGKIFRTTAGNTFSYLDIIK